MLLFGFVVVYRWGLLVLWVFGVYRIVDFFFMYYYWINLRFLRVFGDDWCGVFVGLRVIGC